MKSILTILALAGVLNTPYQDTYVAPLTPKEYAMEIVVATWGIEEWRAFEELIHRESSWIPRGDHNIKLSTAFGLAGFLNGTWQTVGCTKTEDEKEQLRCAILYVQKNYGTPTEAIKKHNRVGWY